MIRRLLLIGDDGFASEALDQASQALGLLIRRLTGSKPIGAALQDFGPDAVALDPAGFEGDIEEALRAVTGSGAALLLMGGPDDRAIQAARAAASAGGLEIAGILAKPVSIEGLEVALRAIAGEAGFSAADVAGAVMRGEITAWYQLQLRRNGAGWRADGAESLARWQHPEHGTLLPDAFVPVAEAEGQIAAITDCVMLASVRQLAVWHRAGLALRVGVNLSPALVTDPEFPERLARLLLEYDVPPWALVLEIPEPGLAAAPPGFLGMLARLRIHGFGLALEHFGSGNSSLADLYRTPFSELKIDRRLTGLLDEDEDARRLVRGIVCLAHELELQTTAEAVESPVALEFLHAAGCDRVQGYVIGRPLPANEFQSILNHWI